MNTQPPTDLTLPPRGQCLEPGCRCGRTVFGGGATSGHQYRIRPIDTAEQCNCRHNWWKHIPFSAPSGRGACELTSCGGYHSSLDGLNTADCVCGRPVGDHEPIVSVPPATPSTNSAASVIARNPPALAYANSQPPSVFQPWNRQASSSAAATANRERKEAMERNRRRGPRSHSSASVISGPSHIQAPTTPPTLLDTSSSTVQLNCAFWPFLVHKVSSSSYNVPEPTFTNRDLGEVVESLYLHHLIFPVALDRSDKQPWKAINHALHELLDAQGYVLTMRHGDIGERLYLLSWDLLSYKKNKKAKNVKIVYRTGSAGPTTFTVDFLSEQAIDVELENPVNDFPFILIAPVEDHLKGPIADGPCPQGIHACFPWRIFTQHSWLIRGSNVECISGSCPSSEEALPLAATGAIVPVARGRRARSPSAAPLPRSAKRARRYVTPSSDEESENETEMPTTNESAPSVIEVPDESDDDYLPDIDGMPELEDVDEWRTRIRSQTTGDFILRAPTTDDASAALIDLLKSLLSGTPPYFYLAQPASIRCRITDTQALIGFLRPFYIGNATRAAIGDGPANAVYQGALDQRVQPMGRWLDINGGFYRTLDLTLQPALVPAKSHVEYQLDGVLTALVLVQLLVEPYPINPFLVYAAFFPDPEQGARAMEFLQRSVYGSEYKREYLFAMIPDKETRKILTSLFLLKKDTKVKTALDALRDPLFRRAIDEPIGAPATLFKEDRDDAQHSTLKQQLFNLILIGHPNPWLHPHFNNFSRGLRLELCNVSSILKPLDEDEDEEELYLYAFKLIATLWNNRIKSPGDITSHTLFLLFNPLEHPGAMVFAQLFRTRFVRWLRGQGHPNELVGGTISKEMQQKSLQSPHTTRAELFWNAVSDLKVLPSSRIWQIEVNITFNPYLNPAEHHIPLKISVCTKTVYVTIGQGVLNLLLEPGDLDDSDDTRFDIWFHPLVAHAIKDYNRT